MMNRLNMMPSKHPANNSDQHISFQEMETHIVSNIIFDTFNSIEDNASSLVSGLDPQLVKTEIHHHNYLIDDHTVIVCTEKKA